MVCEESGAGEGELKLAELEHYVWQLRLMNMKRCDAQGMWHTHCKQVVVRSDVRRKEIVKEAKVLSRSEALCKRRFY